MAQIQTGHNEPQASCSKSAISVEQKVHAKIGKGSRIIVKELMTVLPGCTFLPSRNINFLELLNDVSNQYIVHTLDMGKLPQVTPNNTHFMWSDIQISKGSEHRSKDQS